MNNCQLCSLDFDCNDPHTRCIDTRNVPDTDEQYFDFEPAGLEAPSRPRLLPGIQINANKRESARDNPRALNLSRSPTFSTEQDLPRFAAAKILERTSERRAQCANTRECLTGWETEHVRRAKTTQGNRYDCLSTSALREGAGAQARERHDVPCTKPQGAR